MTQKEFYTNVALETSNEEIKTYCETVLKRIEDRKSESSKKKSEENAPLLEKVTEIFTTNPTTIYRASEIGEKIEVSTSKASSLCRKLEENGIIKSEMIKHDSRKVKGYSLMVKEGD